MLSYILVMLTHELSFARRFISDFYISCQFQLMQGDKKYYIHLLQAYIHSYIHRQWLLLVMMVVTVARFFFFLHNTKHVSSFVLL